MNSISSFFGKCLTVLIGVALSWSTVTNPKFDSVAAKFFGTGSQTADLDATLGRTPPEVDTPLDGLRNGDAVEHEDQDSSAAIGISQGPSVVQFPQTPSEWAQTRIEEISAELRQLGASYLVLERLTQPDGVQYRVRCDLANREVTVKCCFEATRKSALDAMEDVLRAARSTVDPPARSTVDPPADFSPQAVASST